MFPLKGVLNTNKGLREGSHGSYSDTCVPFYCSAGNPTNIIVAMAYRLSFLDYSKWMALPTIGVCQSRAAAPQ